MKSMKVKEHEFIPLPTEVIDLNAEEPKLALNTATKERILSINKMCCLVTSDATPGTLIPRIYSERPNPPKAVKAHDGAILLAEFSQLDANVFVTLGEDLKLFIWAVNEIPSFERLGALDLTKYCKGSSAKDITIKWSSYSPDHFICYSPQFIVSYQYMTRDSELYMEIEEADEVSFLYGSVLHYLVFNKATGKLSVVQHNNNAPKPFVHNLEVSVQSPLL